MKPKPLVELNHLTVPWDMGATFAGVAMLTAKHEAARRSGIASEYRRRPLELRGRPSRQSVYRPLQHGRFGRHLQGRATPLPIGRPPAKDVDEITPRDASAIPGSRRRVRTRRNERWLESRASRVTNAARRVRLRGGNT